MQRAAEVDNYVRREIVSLKQPNLSWFAPSQISTLDDVIRTIAPLTAAQLLRMNQDDTRWKELGNNSAMSIATGSVVTRPLTSE